MLRTVSKIGPVLDLFTVEHPEWGVSEAAEALGVPKSSAHALLSTLADVGLLAATSHIRYRLGWRVLALGETLRATLDLRSAAHPANRFARGWSSSGTPCAPDGAGEHAVARLQGTPKRASVLASPATARAGCPSAAAPTPSATASLPRRSCMPTVASASSRNVRLQGPTTKPP